MSDVTPVEQQPRASKTFVRIFMTSMLALVVISMILLTVAPVIHWFVFPGQALPDGMESQSKITFGVLLGAVLTMLKDYMGLQ